MTDEEVKRVASLVAKEVDAHLAGYDKRQGDRLNRMSAKIKTLRSLIEAQDERHAKMAATLVAIFGTGTDVKGDKEHD